MPLAGAIILPFFLTPGAVAASPPAAKITIENRTNFPNLAVEPRSRPTQNSTKLSGAEINLTSDKYPVKINANSPLIAQTTNNRENLPKVPLSEIIETGKIPTPQPVLTEPRNTQNPPNSVQVQTFPEDSIPIPILPPANDTPPSETFRNQNRELRDILNLQPSPLPNVRGDNISLNDFPALPTIETSVFSPPINNFPNTTDPNLTPQTSQYKVIVETRNSGQEAIVRSLVPGAFRIVYNGRSMMQVGLFDNIENAQEIIRTLNRSGLQGIIVPL
ncbi:MAG: hypothetical protein SAJ37_19455 [Oscillatoria sp. PMC 1068.18]|nr:hypothetical protein [Oscillatoria sp. PMC 1076.18]MEC4990915.1 hypothetical protein [Oscillatoria sp. PMC 1068.18]